jgi:2-oxoglutarate ferredoxin oxidoreductase subunit alpha
MPTRTQQGDLQSCAHASHGDTKHICLYPSDPKEAFEMAAQAFDLAEQFQTPVFVLSDLDIGMNDWMIPKLTWDDNKQPNRGKVLHAAELDEIKKYGRYLDVDGDFIPYRTIPGESAKGAYVARGSGHNKMAGYTEDAAEYTEVVDRINQKIQSASTAVPQPFFRRSEGANIGLISIGGCHGAAMEALDILAADGLKLDYMRIRGYPFCNDVKAFLESHEVLYIVEQNLSAQLRNMIAVETEVPMQK